MHRFDTPSFIHVIYRRQKSDEIVQKNIMDFEHPTLGENLRHEIELGVF